MNTHDTVRVSHFKNVPEAKSPLENSIIEKQPISRNESYNWSTKDGATLFERNSSASRDSSARAANSNPLATQVKATPQAEVKDGFLNEERVAFWENLKAHLGDLYSKKPPPVESQNQRSDDRNRSQSKNGGLVKEERNTPRMENTEARNRPPVKPEPREQPAEEKSFSRRKGAGSVEAKDQLPTKQFVRPHEAATLKQSQTIGDHDRVKRNNASKRKMDSLQSSKAVGRTDDCKLENKSFPKVEDNPATKENRNTVKRKILNKNVNKNIECFAAETREKTQDGRLNFLANQAAVKEAGESYDLRNLLNSKPKSTTWRQRVIPLQRDVRSVVLKDDGGGGEREGEEELVVEVPGRRSRRTEDASLEFDGEGRRLNVELNGRRRNAGERRGVELNRNDIDSEFVGKRFKFNQGTSAHCFRGGFRRRGGEGRRFAERSKDDRMEFNERSCKFRRLGDDVRRRGNFQDRYSEEVSVDNRRGSVQGSFPNADADDRLPGDQERRENPDNEEYFQGDASDRISRARRHDRGLGNIEDRYEGDHADKYTDDVDERFRGSDNNDCYDDDMRNYRRGNYETCPRKPVTGRDADLQGRDREDCDERYSNDHTGKLRGKSSSRYSNNSAEGRYGGEQARCSYDDPEGYCVRYSVDNTEELHEAHSSRNDADERFNAENNTRYSTDDFEEPYDGSYFNQRARYKGRPYGGRAESKDTPAVDCNKLKEPKAFLKDLEQNPFGGERREPPTGIKVTVGGDFHEDRYSWDAENKGCQDEEMIRDVEDNWVDSRGFDRDGRRNETAPLPSWGTSYTRARFGGPSSGNSFQTRSWKQKFLHKSMQRNQWQPRLGYRRKFGFQPQYKKLVPPMKFMKRPVSEFAMKTGRNIPDASKSMQEAIKQVINNLKETEMVDPKADAELFDTLSRGEKKQVVEIQQMTGIQCVSAIVTAIRTLWKFEPKVVRTLGSLEPEEIEKLGLDG